MTTLFLILLLSALLVGLPCGLGLLCLCAGKRENGKRPPLPLPTTGQLQSLHQQRRFFHLEETQRL